MLWRSDACSAGRKKSRAEKQRRREQESNEANQKEPRRLGEGIAVVKSTDSLSSLCVSASCMVMERDFYCCSWAVGMWASWMMSTYPQQGPVDPVGNTDVVHKSTGRTKRGCASCIGAGRPIASRAAEPVAEQGSPVVFSLFNPNSCSVPLMRARISQDREPENHD